MRILLSARSLISGRLKFSPHLLYAYRIDPGATVWLPSGQVEEDSCALCQTGCPMTDPLTSDVHREPNEELVLDHLERRRVPVAHQVSNQSPIVSCGLRTLPVGDARRLNDSGVVPHVVNQSHEPMGKDGMPNPDLLVR